MLLYVIKRCFSQIPLPNRSVYVSLSKNVYTNLALEDWLFENTNFNHQNILLIWRNAPCVVIGTFQNPWLETDPSALPHIGEGIQLARRRSGGGTVYHDDGNLNLTFFSSRKDYKRKPNLEFVQKILKEKYELAIDVSSKYDLTLDGAKISGSASKLGLNSAYHHCSLLVNVNKKLLNEALQKSNLLIQSNATKSVRSNIMNLIEKHPSITVERLIKDCKEEYLKDGGDFQFVDPEEIHFPGITFLKNHFTSWEWLYGRSPRFLVLKSFENFGNVTVVVEKGKMTDFVCENYGDVSIFQEFLGRKFDEKVFSHLSEVPSHHCSNVGNKCMRELLKNAMC